MLPPLLGIAEREIFHEKQKRTVYPPSFLGTFFCTQGNFRAYFLQTHAAEARYSGMAANCAITETAIIAGMLMS